MEILSRESLQGFVGFVGFRWFSLVPGGCSMAFICFRSFLEVPVIDILWRVSVGILAREFL